MKKTCVCIECGGSNLVWDATAIWDIEKQDFEYELTEHDPMCLDCDTDVDWMKEVMQ